MTDETQQAVEAAPYWDADWLRWMESVPHDWRGAAIDLAHEAYAQARADERAKVQPDPQELLRQLLWALGEFDGARPEHPAELWKMALVKVRALRGVQPDSAHTAGCATQTTFGGRCNCGAGNANRE